MTLVAPEVEEVEVFQQPTSPACTAWVETVEIDGRIDSRVWCVRVGPHEPHVSGELRWWGSTEER